MCKGLGMQACPGRDRRAFPEALGLSLQEQRPQQSREAEVRLRSQSRGRLSLGDRAATQGGPVRSGSWCVCVTVGAGAPLQRPVRERIR